MPSTLRVLPATIAGCGPDATVLEGGLAAGGGFVDGGGLATGSARVASATEVEAAGETCAVSGAFGTVSNTGALFCERVSRDGAFATVPRTGPLDGGATSIRSTCPG